MATGTIVKNKDDFMRKLRACSAKIEEKFRWKVYTAVHMAHELILEATPVNTGLTLVNYVWSVGAPVIQTIEPMGISDFRGTNQMDLGQEPRRAENMGPPTMSLMGLDFSNPYKLFILSNTGPAIMGLEHGLLPDGIDKETGMPYRHRSPDGMFLKSLTYIAARLQNNGAEFAYE
jgi:hypothetical protein